MDKGCNGLCQVKIETGDVPLCFVFFIYRVYPFVDIFILPPGDQARCLVKGTYHKLESSTEAGLSIIHLRG